MSVATVEGKRDVRTFYPWYLLGMLWLCGFFNYADRMAVNAVFPLLKTEFQLSNVQLGLLASSFMIVYAVSAPFSGYLVDRASRRFVIATGLAFWSLICAATGLARSFGQLIFLRGAEGLGESFYFPASMTILADYHPPTSRSRAMSIHQTSVYLGTAGGMALAGQLAQGYGWRMPFLFLGLTGTVYAVWLWTQIVEPVRGKSEQKDTLAAPYAEPPDDEIAPPRSNLGANLAEIMTTPSAALLLAAFVGANFVATAFMTWLPMFLTEAFGLGVASSSLTSTTWSLASLVGVLAGGVLADLGARRVGGRMRVQGFALLAAGPLVFWVSRAGTLPLVVVALAGVGFCKGVYDASIFASLFDVTRPSIRGTASGLMNTVGWTGGALAPVVIGLLSERYGLASAIGATAPVYIVAGFLAIGASVTAARKSQVVNG